MTGPHGTSQWTGVNVKYNSAGRFLWHSPNRVEALWFKTLPILAIKLRQRSRVGIWESLICRLKPGLTRVLKGRKRKHNCVFCLFFFLLDLVDWTGGQAVLRIGLEEKLDTQGGTSCWTECGTQSLCPENVSEAAMLGYLAQVLKWKSKGDTGPIAHPRYSPHGPIMHPRYSPHGYLMDWFSHSCAWVLTMKFWWQIKAVTLYFIRTHTFFFPSLLFFIMCIDLSQAFLGSRSFLFCYFPPPFLKLAPWILHDRTDSEAISKASTWGALKA